MHNNEEFENQAWKKMSIILDQEMPEKKRRIIWWPWLSLGFLFIIVVLSFFIYHSKERNLEVFAANTDSIVYDGQNGIYPRNSIESKFSKLEPLALINDEKELALTNDEKESQEKNDTPFNLNRYEEESYVNHSSERDIKIPIKSKTPIVHVNQPNNDSTLLNVSGYNGSHNDNELILTIKSTKNPIHKEKLNDSFIEGWRILKIEEQLDIIDHNLAILETDKKEKWMPKGELLLGASYALITGRVGIHIESRMLFKKKYNPFHFAVGLGISRYSNSTILGNDNNVFDNNGPEITNNFNEDKSNVKSTTTLSVPMRVIYGRRSIEVGAGIDYIYNINHDDIVVQENLVNSEKFWNEHNWALTLETSIILNSYFKLFGSFSHDLEIKSTAKYQLSNIKTGFQYSF